MFSAWYGLWQIKRFSKKKTESDQLLRDKAFRIVRNPKYGGYQRGLASMVYNFSDKKSSGSAIVNESNYQLANELHKPIIQKFRKRKAYSSFRENIWGVDLADIQSLRKYNKANKYLIRAISIYYVQLISLANMRGLFL